jgi:phosphate transport system substrate-binding protein
MRVLFLIPLALALSQLTGCTPSARDGQPPNSAIAIKGSDSMMHLVTAWSEDYMKQYPAVEVSVTGGGSGTGIAALLNKTSDICAASRDMTPAEKDQAAQKGLRLRETVVARDGIAIIVNPSNPVNELTLEQLRKIYTGADSNWADVGGQNGGIIVLSRETSSGTYAFLQEHVLKKQDFTPKALLMPATSSIVEAVASDASAIGYVGLGYATQARGRVKVLNIKADDDAPAVAPSEETVRAGAYSISRPLYFYTYEGGSAAVEPFIQFCLGDAGQKIVREAGYVPIR